MSRTLTFLGTGTLATWFDPGGLADKFANNLRVNGFGFTDLDIKPGLTGTNSTLLGIANPILQTIANAVSYNYNITVTLTGVPDDQNPEQSREQLTRMLSDLFTNVNLRLSHDSAHPVSAFLQNYGLWIAGGFAALLIFKSLSSTAVAYAPTARSYFIHR